MDKMRERYMENITDDIDVQIGVHVNKFANFAEMKNDLENDYKKTIDDRYCGESEYIGNILTWPSPNQILPLILGGIHFSNIIFRKGKQEPKFVYRILLPERNYR
jgi:hypothetical protein